MDAPKTIAPKLNSFVAFIDPQSQAARPTPIVPSLRFQTTITTVNHSITIHYGDSDMLTTSADDQCTLLLVGEIYRPQTSNAGETLLGLYERQGLDFIRALNGEFCLLLIDRRSDLIAVATDKENSFKVLVSDFDSRLVISNSTYLQPVQNARIDRTALACYLAAGFAFNERTLFEGVRVLESASIYRVHGRSLTQQKYWQIVFAPTRHVAVSTLQHELGDLLVESVRVRTQHRPSTYLSLSAGTDSSAVLGILADYLHVPDVQCFTYAYGAVRPGTDEALAGQRAALCGYPHMVIPSFDGDVVSTLKLNGRMGGGMAEVCDEVDAWVRLGATIDDGVRPVLLTGDTHFVGLDFRMRTDEHAVAGAFMADFTELAWLKRGIGSATYDEFLAATHAEIDRALKHLQPTDNPFDRRDLLRYYQTRNRRIATWREYYSGRFFRPVHPFSDDDILEFYAQLPVALRHSKRLYMSTVKRMFPRLFELPTATYASYNGYWETAIQAQSVAIRSQIQSEASPLDEIIQPELLLAVLAGEVASGKHAGRMSAILMEETSRLVKQTPLRWLSYAAPYWFRHRVPPRVFLARALTLRCFLSEVRNHPLIQSTAI